MNTLKKTGVRIAVFAAAAAFLWGCLMLSALIPNEKIYDRMLASAVSFSTEQAYTFHGERLCNITDNLDDAILLGIAWNVRENPLLASLDTKYYDGNDGKTDYGESYGLFLVLQGLAEPNTDYTRYWHGTVALIRPLLLFTDVNGIRFIGFCAALILLAVNTGFLVFKKQHFCAAALLVSFACVHFWNVRLCMEYQPSVLVCLALLPFFILFEERNNILPILSVISGVAVAFFDFLTAETLTILIPLAVVFTMREKENRNLPLKKNLYLAADCGFSWVLAYGGMFVLKWSAASLITGENKFTAAFSSVAERVNGEVFGFSPVKMAFLAPFANLSMMFGGIERVSWGNIGIGFLLLLFFISGAVYIFRRKEFNRDFTVIMLTLCGIVYLRYIILANHSYLHGFFTYRSQAAAIYALLAATWYNMDIKIRKRKKKVK